MKLNISISKLDLRFQKIQMDFQEIEVLGISTQKWDKYVDGHKLYFLSEIVVWSTVRNRQTFLTLKKKTMPKNEFICKFGVYNIGFNGHKNPQVNAAYHDYAHLIPIKLLFFI